MKFNYAILTINKISGDPVTVDICFDWRTFEGEHEEERWAQVKSWTFPHENLETLFEILGKEHKDESALLAMGDQIWRLFPLNIQDSIIKFEGFAESVYKGSKSLLPLIIFTDCLNIPWELCITRKNIPEEQKIPWYKQFMIATQICGVSRFDEMHLEKERKNVSLILTPFPVTEEEEGLLNEYDDLLNLISYLESELNINIELHRCPERPNELYKIEEILQKGDHDLLIYVGSRVDKKITLYNPATKKPEYFEMKNICSGSNVEKAIFLDACSTAIEKEANSFICEEPSKFLSQNTAFIGTITDIRMTPAIVFALHFLKSLFTKGASLSEAVYEAKNITYEALKEKYPNNEEYRTQSCFFTLYGRNDDILLNSFQYPRKKIYFIYPKMIEQHTGGFIDFIYPSSLPMLELKKKDTLEDVIDEIEPLEEGFIADLSITHATNLISNCRGDPDKELVIIGGVFRLLPEPSDSTLYFFDKLSDYDFFYSLDPQTTVNIMAITYFVNDGNTRKKSVSKISQRRMNYPEIYKNALDAIDNNTPFEPFIMIGNYKERFEKELEKRNVERDINRIHLYSVFLDILEQKYPRYKFSQNLPGEVLVARKKDVEKDVMMYREIFTKWMYWEIENKDKVPKGQEVFISLTSEDIDTLMKFTQFVSEELKEFSYVKGPLNKNDFIIIQPWKEEKLIEAKYKGNEEIKEFQKKNNEIIERLERKFSQYQHPEGKIIDAEAITRWLRQFETTEKVRLALILLENIVFINRKMMKDMFQHYYENLPAEEKNKIILTNLGGLYDSSNLVSYFLGDIGMKLGIRSADLRSILEVEDPKEKVILFVDDNIGSGKQAVDIFRELLASEEKELKERHEVKLSKAHIEKLKKFKLHLFTFVGFEEGKREFVIELQKLGLIVEEPYSFLKMEEKIGCFHPTSTMFDTLEDREAAKVMCREIGYQLLSDKINWSNKLREKRSLGYGNSQKLIVFFYNVPTSTLPILWKKGKYNNIKWEPLFMRREKK